MANIEEIEGWDEGIYQLETIDPVEGGADGVDNAPHKNLANRTQWLKAQMLTLSEGKADLSSFENSKTTNGYQKLPNGLIFQWGQSNAEPLPDGALVVFPIAFPNGCFTITTSDYSNDNLYYHGIDSISNTSFKLYTTHSSLDAARWIAIGY